MLPAVPTFYYIRQMDTLVDDLSHRLAQRLRLERDGRGWSLAELAERAGVSKATISKIERAEVVTARRMRLVHRHLGADLVQGQRRGQPTDTAADDQDPHPVPLSLSDSGAAVELRLLR